jgi:hypothetical protein
MATNIPAVGEALAFVQGNPIYQSVIQMSNDAEKIIDTAPIIPDFNISKYFVKLLR